MRDMAAEPRLGTTIRRARERKRWTQQQLADALSVSVRTVNDWENDRSYPRNSIGALEQVLDVRFGDDEPRARTISPELRRLIADVLAGDVDAQRRVIGLLEGTLVWPEESAVPEGNHSAAG